MITAIAEDRELANQGCNTRNHWHKPLDAIGITIIKRHIQGDPLVRSQFRILITFSIFNVLTKFKHLVTQKGWEFFLI